MNEKCKNCKYFHRLKHNYKRGQGFQHSNVCDVLLHIEGSDGWIREVNKDSKCEMFTEKEET